MQQHVTGLISNEFGDHDDHDDHNDHGDHDGHDGHDSHDDPTNTQPSSKPTHQPHINQHNKAQQTTHVTGFVFNVSVVVLFDGCLRCCC